MEFSSDEVTEIQYAIGDRMRKLEKELEQLLERDEREVYYSIDDLERKLNLLHAAWNKFS